MPSNLLRKGFQGAIYHYATSAIVAILNLCITIFIVRKLTIAEFGTYNLLLAAIFLITTITSFGTDAIIKRYLPEYDEKNDTYNKKRIVGGSLLLRFLTSIVILGILFVVKKHIMHILHLPEHTDDIFFVALDVVPLKRTHYRLGNVGQVVTDLLQIIDKIQKDNSGEDKTFAFV